MTETSSRPEPTGPDPTSTDPPSPRPPRTRWGTTWVMLLTATLVLLLLLVFILQNQQRADVSFLGAHGHLPIGVALLLAAVFGVLLVALPGTARIVQLRMAGRRRATRLPAPPADAEPVHHDSAAS